MTRRSRSAMKLRVRSPDPRGAIGVVGLGYVGLATAVAFAHYGRSVVGFDVLPDRREAIARGEAPFFEPGFQATLTRVVRSGKLSVVDSARAALERSELLFLAVPTPSTDEGEVDLSFVRSACEELGRAVRSIPGWRGIVVKSTVVPRSTEKVVEPTLRSASGRSSARSLGVAVNPEFLSEGTLVADALRPTRIIVGTSDARTLRCLRAAYRGFPAPLLNLTPAGAELVKYTANALLATKVSFANEIARLAERTGVDIDGVMAAVGLDPRLGQGFLRAGPGFGGSCFTKDLKALLACAAELGLRLEIPRSVLAVNESQPAHVADLAELALGSLSGQTVALLGLAFKEETSDVRDSRAYPLLRELLRRNARVILHDPNAGPAFLAGLPRELRKLQGGDYRLETRLLAALSDSDLAIIHTGWSEYARLPSREWQRLRQRVVVDTRRILRPDALARLGVEYVGVGRPLPESRAPRA
ncbi:MAG: UDP-glucose/GDP-mannose dehydrogenase family protein [Thermoplasmata archaeon]|nr:UDP-glucose/GDP-mannose dehydrogenase family protein [Thermoplasmata archaeon]